MQIDNTRGWQRQKLLGQGHFAPVYLVRREGATGAMKVASTNNRESTTRLGVEVEALTVFDHPAIPKLLDKDLSGEEQYLVMSLAQGETLLDRTKRWQKQGRVHGEFEAARILMQLTDAVAYVHSKDYVHRDIKDANIIDDGSHVTLLDFGFCKRSGTTDMRTDDSFWRAGAARFAPIAKLNDPTKAVPGHDVYALGVIAYRLLTGAYPWSVDVKDGLGPLKQALQTLRPAPVHDVNSLVSLNLSRLVSRMLVQEDEYRITSRDALSELERIVRDNGQRKVVSVLPSRSMSFPHVIRDSVHGDVRISSLEYEVLNTKEMQRLRWIKQLGLTNLIYPGAEHSRLSHSIGCLDRVETMLRAIEDESGTRIDLDTRTVTRLYALTHDVGHIAMGHTIEDQLGFFARHDSNVGRFQRLLGSEKSDLGRLLNESDEGKATLTLLDPSSSDEREGIAYQAVAGPMGADLLDY